MKVSELIAYVDEIKPNAFSDAVKLSWLNEVEGMVQLGVMLLDPAELVTYTTADTGDELLAAPPYDKLYRAYLCACVDLANGEYKKYANTMAVFNAQYGEYMRWYAERYRPADGGCIVNGYYITAYGLAVKHGFGGDEAAWLVTLKGDKGDQGDPGDSFVILGFYPTLEALETDVTSPGAGEAYGIGTAAPYDIYIWDGVGAEWVNNGNLKGETGDTGATGPQGIQGPKGDKGEYRLAGRTGYPGSEGRHRRDRFPGT